MKLKQWMVLAVTLTTGVVARQLLADQPPAAGGGPAATQPAKPAGKGAARPAARTPAPPAEAEKYTPVTEPGPAIVRQNVNVRGQASINSEVVTRLKKGDKVAVLEEITLKKPKTDEPAKWARIALPAGAPVWVHSSFVDAATKTVKSKKLNLRSGPGENYSVIGHLEKGAAIKEIEAKGDWLKIEAPEKSFAFVAAHFLSQDAGATFAAVTPPPPTPTPTPPAPVPTVVIPPTPPPVPAIDPTPTPPPAPIVTTPPARPTPATPTYDDSVIVRRVVTRKGIVKGSVSIQAPTYFGLRSLDNGRTINYLFSTSTNISIKEFNEQKVLVTGEESLDERWPNTPVLTLESIQSLQE